MKSILNQKIFFTIFLSITCTCINFTFKVKTMNNTNEKINLTIKEALILMGSNIIPSFSSTVTDKTSNSNNKNISDNSFNKVFNFVENQINNEIKIGLEDSTEEYIDVEKDIEATNYNYFNSFNSIKDRDTNWLEGLDQYEKEIKRNKILEILKKMFKTKMNKYEKNKNFKISINLATHIISYFDSSYTNSLTSSQLNYSSNSSKNSFNDCQKPLPKDIPPTIKKEQTDSWLNMCNIL